MNHDKCDHETDCFLCKLEADAKDRKKRHEDVALEVVNFMCQESLCPQTFEAWEMVKSQLCAIRGMKG